MVEVRLIAAIDDKLGIAKKGKIPWDLPSDRKYFRDHIKLGPVVMGWKTFASNKFKPYGEGANTVITKRDTESIPGVWVAHSAHEFFEKNRQDIWVAGGGQIFKEALPYATELYLTRVSGNFDCDMFFPEFYNTFELAEEKQERSENGIVFKYQVWKRKA